MGDTDYKWYVLFPNHHEGLKLNQELKGRGIQCTIAPTPRAASTSCGISLIVMEVDLPVINEIINDLEVKIEKTVKLPVKKNWQYKSC